MSRRSPRAAAAVAFSLGFGMWASGASAQSALAQSPLNNFIEVLVVDRELLAFDAFGTKNFRTRLELEEEVIWSAAQGLVGVVITTRRALAVTPGASDWQAVNWRASEEPVDAAVLGDRLALLSTHLRVLAFDSLAGAWFQENVGPGEEVSALRAGQNSGVVVTNRRALGIGPDARGFFDTRLRLHEDIEHVNADANLATIMTSERVLVFRSQAGSWSEHARRIHR